MAKPKVAPQMKEESRNPKKGKCTCPQEFQDKIYGKGVRVHNKTNKPSEFRCTGCGVSRVL